MKGTDVTVKYIAALGYTATWGVIVLGIFRGLPIAVWFVMLALAFLGAMAAWNTLPQPSRPASQPATDAATAKAEASRDASQSS